MQTRHFYKTIRLFINYLVDVETVEVDAVEVNAVEVDAVDVETVEVDAVDVNAVEVDVDVGTVELKRSIFSFKKQVKLCLFCFFLLRFKSTSYFCNLIKISSSF